MDKTIQTIPPDTPLTEADIDALGITITPLDEIEGEETENEVK